MSLIRFDLHQPNEDWIKGSGQTSVCLHRCRRDWSNALLKKGQCWQEQLIDKLPNSCKTVQANCTFPASIRAVACIKSFLIYFYLVVNSRTTCYSLYPFTCYRIFFYIIFFLSWNNKTNKMKFLLLQIATFSIERMYCVEKLWKVQFYLWLLESTDPGDVFQKYYLNIPSQKTIINPSCIRKGFRFW